MYISSLENTLCGEKSTKWFYCFLRNFFVVVSNPNVKIKKKRKYIMRSRLPSHKHSRKNKTSFEFLFYIRYYGVN